MKEGLELGGWSQHLWAEKRRRRSPVMTTEGGVEVQFERKARQGSRERKKDPLGPL